MMSLARSSLRAGCWERPWASRLCCPMSQRQRPMLGVETAFQGNVHGALALEVLA